MKYSRYSFKITGADGNDDLLQSACDVFCALVAEVGFESFEQTDYGVDGYIPTNSDNRKAIEAVIADFPIEGVCIDYTSEDIEDENWNRLWESEGFEPINVAGRCVIHDMLHPLPQDIDENVLEIVIDTEQAFGTGTHETTYMIVEHILSMNMSGKSVLDCGCGTGILSVVASRSGAERVVGYDIDEWSVRNTLHNAEINGVENIEVRHGDSSVLNTLDETFDVVIANINRNILLADMSDFRRMMNPTAILVLSGFYVDDIPLLREKASTLGLSLDFTKDKNNWAMAVFSSSANHVNRCHC